MGALRFFFVDGRRRGTNADGGGDEFDEEEEDEAAGHVDRVEDDGGEGDSVEQRDDELLKHFGGQVAQWREEAVCPLSARSRVAMSTLRLT